MGKRVVIGIWSTEAEKNYLNHIGEYCLNNKKYTKLERLMKYCETMEKRVNWDAMNKAVLMAFVDRLIDRFVQKETLVA